MNFLDLFSGCGGFSLGLKLAGLNEIAAIDNNPYAINVLKANFPEVLALQEDLTRFGPELLRRYIGDVEIDIIVGGPPCQGFSTVRQRDGSNSGSRIIQDDRRELYKEFLKFVEFYKPKVFVIENVLGIRSAAGGTFFTKVQSESRNLGYRIQTQILHAWEFGVPQKRERQFIIGTRTDLPVFSSYFFIQKTHSVIPNEISQPIVTLGEAIGDLPELKAGEGQEEMPYDLHQREMHIQKYTGRYTEEILNVSKAMILTSHLSRKHSERDLRDFGKILEGENSAKTLKRGIELETPYDRSTFKDRYTRQHRDKLCSTIVAHLSKDGLMFIHPTQNRSLTPREAARIQSFPDTFNFPVSRTRKFQLIGNAVPPQVGKAVGLGILRWEESFTNNQFAKKTTISKDDAQANFNNLLSLIEESDLSMIPTEILVKGWKGLLQLNKHLHPDGFLENNRLILSTQSSLSIIEPMIDERSGWPVQYLPLAEEIRKRFDLGEVNYFDYYDYPIIFEESLDSEGEDNV